MNLISCDECAVALDANKLEFPKDIHRKDGSIDSAKAAWNGDNFVPKVECPHCGFDILKP